MTLRISATAMKTISEHVRREEPDECCGILVGRQNGEIAAVCEVHPVLNVWDGPRRDRYMLDPRAHLQIQREARERGLHVVGFYHSHLKGHPEPSAFDAELAWPGHSYLIVTSGNAAEGAASGEAKSWRWDEVSRRFTEERLLIELSVAND